MLVIAIVLALDLLIEVYVLRVKLKMFSFLSEKKSQQNILTKVKRNDKIQISCDFLK